ncbi:MAG: UPF0175 family protein [Candidatus Helarchaeota archaeon]
MGVLSVRLDSELEEKLQYLMEKRKIRDKSAYVRQLISESLTKELLDYLCKEVSKRNISAWKAAEIAKISLRAMLKELAERNIPSYDEIAFKEDLLFLGK